MKRFVVASRYVCSAPAVRRFTIGAGWPGIGAVSNVSGWKFEDVRDSKRMIREMPIVIGLATLNEMSPPWYATGLMRVSESGIQAKFQKKSPTSAVTPAFLY